MTSCFWDLCMSDAERTEVVVLCGAGHFTRRAKGRAYFALTLRCSGRTVFGSTALDAENDYRITRIHWNN
jgi:hypothetical protein